MVRAIIYDYETDTASGYSQDEVDRLITSIPQNEDTFSKPLLRKRALEAIQRDKDRLMDMIYMVQTLLSGDSEKFFNAVDTGVSATRVVDHHHNLERAYPQTPHHGRSAGKV